MKLGSLKNGKFEVLNDDTMKFLSGGFFCATGSGSIAIGFGIPDFKYSSDSKEYNDKTGKPTSLRGYYGSTNSFDAQNPNPVCGEATYK